MRKLHVSVMKRQSIRTYIWISLFVVFINSTAYELAEMITYNNLPITGKQLQLIEDQVEDLKIQNNMLEIEVANLGAVSSISERAKEVGMIESRVQFINDYE